MRIRAFVAGHTGLVGSAFVRALEKSHGIDIITRERQELDLRDGKAVLDFFSECQPDWVILAAAKVGSIKANIESPCDFLLDNIKIQTNVIEAAHRLRSKKLIFFGSNCMYPGGRNESLDVGDLLTGPPEATNEPYAIAKISGWKLCEAYNKQYGTNFFTIIPASVIGLNDHYDLNRAHVVSALIRKFHDAKIAGETKVIVWGSGKPLRQFIWSDDLAEFGIKIFRGNYLAQNLGPMNVGSDLEFSVLQIAEKVRSIVHPNAEIVLDRSHPDGVFRKHLISHRLFSGSTSNLTKNFEENLNTLYLDFLGRVASKKI